MERGRARLEPRPDPAVSCNGSKLYKNLPKTVIPWSSGMQGLPHPAFCRKPSCTLDSSFSAAWVIANHSLPPVSISWVSAQLWRTTPNPLPPPAKGTDWHASDRRCPRQSFVSSSWPWRQTRLNTEAVLQRRGQNPPQSDSLGFIRSPGLLGISSQPWDHPLEAPSYGNAEGRQVLCPQGETTYVQHSLQFSMWPQVNCFLNYYEEGMGAGVG